ncbi:hypothetical protein PIIN_05152 [Serendipita indica DSM 11827]|uniref:Uncharacterized protein n=1 Tax=Serendipita indica (strain DSM 11827) TaxID=1109443 RepID=G4TIS2_SERID|nr:hypothetical protein PIIN_05152 [Serendipita indica DSM 11827]
MQAQLPVPIKADVASLVVVAQTIAVTSSLFAAVQISFNSIIEAAVFTSETPQLRGYTLKTWLYLRWFLYAAVIVNLGSAGAAVAVINLATSLECEFSRFAVLYHHGDKEALRRYKDAYDWVLTRKLPSKYVKEKYTFERLQQFGMDKRVSWISYGMALSFATGVVFAFVSFVYWVALTQGVAAVVVMAVMVALGIILTLSFTIL